MISRLLYSYIIREYLKVFFAALGGFLFVCLVGDAAERMSDFVDTNAPVRLILLFYVNQMPYYLIFILPASSLIATLFTMGQMSRHNELTAMLSSGVSLGRIFRPILLLMLVVSALSFLVNETVVPRTNEKKKEIQDYQIKGRPRPVYGVRKGVDYQGEQGRRWIASQFNLAAASFEDVKVLRFSGPPEDLQIDYRIDAEGARYENLGHWSFSSGTMRYFSPDRQDEWVVSFDRMVLPDLLEKPEDFVIEIKEAQQMSFSELKAEIKRKSRNGLDVSRDETELWIKTALPVANFIIVLFGAPLAVLRRGTGPGVGIALGVVVYMLFMGSYYLTRSMGYSGVISPVAAAWTSNVIFAAAGITIFIRVRK